MQGKSHNLIHSVDILKPWPRSFAMPRGKNWHQSSILLWKSTPASTCELRSVDAHQQQRIDTYRKKTAKGSEDTLPQTNPHPETTLHELPWASWMKPNSIIKPFKASKHQGIQPNWEDSKISDPPSISWPGIRTLQAKDKQASCLESRVGSLLKLLRVDCCW